MVRNTSRRAYREIKDEGLLSKRRFEVYRALFRSGPMTQSETHTMLGVAQSSITPRFAELKKLGVICEVGEVKCGITGRNVHSWDVTKNLPVKPEPSQRELRKYMMKHKRLYRKYKSLYLGTVVEDD